MNKDEQGRTIKGLVTALDKQFGKGAVMALGTVDSDPVLSTPTGSAALDLALGIGGYPRGRVVELFGPEGSGKTTLALHAIAASQKAGGIVAFIDADHTLDVTYAKAIGVGLERLLVSQPDTGEQALEIAEALVRSGAVDMIVVSGSLWPKTVIEGEYGAEDHGLQARLMSQALRKLTAIAHRTQTTLIFLNHRAQDGNALKFYASARLDVRRIGTEESGDARVKVKVVKNKCAPPFTEATVLLRHGVGLVTEEGQENK